MSPAERSAAQFWAKVRRGDGCWLWVGARINDGYGLLKRSGKTVLAHRYAYELTHGPVPDGRVVMHTCDTPACVRPEHLRVGTNRDNSRDMAAKGRAGGRLKLTTEFAELVRAAYGAGEKIHSIAERHGIAGRTVQKAVLSAPSLPRAPQRCAMSGPHYVREPDGLHLCRCDYPSQHGRMLVPDSPTLLRVLAEAREVIADAVDGERSPTWGKAAMATLDHIDELLARRGAR